MRGLLLLCSWLVAFGLRAQADSTQALVISAAYSLPLSQAQVIERAQRAWTQTFGREPGAAMALAREAIARRLEVRPAVVGQQFAELLDVDLVAPKPQPPEGESVAHADPSVQRGVLAVTQHRGVGRGQWPRVQHPLPLPRRRRERQRDDQRHRPHLHDRGMPGDRADGDDRGRDGCRRRGWERTGPGAWAAR